MRSKKLISIVVLIVFIMGLAISGASAGNVNIITNTDGTVQMTLNFSDMKEAQWALKQITKMKSQNIINGYSDGSFKPNKAVSHAEAVVMTMKAAGLQSEMDALVVDSVYLPYKDAKNIPTWAKNAVALAYKKGYLSASQSDNFQPQKPASREWVIMLICKALNIQPITVTLPFSDASNISTDALGYVAAVVYKQLISGFPDGSFKPNKSITRAEIAVLLGICTDEAPIPGKIRNKVEGVVLSVYEEANSSQSTQGTITLEVEKREGKANNDKRFFKLDADIDEDEDEDEVDDKVYETVYDKVYHPDVDEDEDKDEDEDENKDDISEVSGPVSFPVAEDARIYVNEKEASLDDIVKGSTAIVIVNKNGIVDYIEVAPVIVKGVVQSVYGDILTIIEQENDKGRKKGGRKGDSIEYTVASNAVIVINGVTTTLAELKKGDVVKLAFDADGKVHSIKGTRFEKFIEKQKEKIKDKLKVQIRDRNRDRDRNNNKDD
jgi:hypothetical protein